VYVCICAAVSESEIHTCIDGGADTPEAIGYECSAGTGCGSCLQRVEEILERRTLTARLSA
jgi:bacterioferritin-associated ferredoxin